ncbi:MAG TPA: hypothetical protein VMQ51_09825 [Candidatus Binatia bacterium]|nr:hypothetical protein [Candidatus Binatia bacterium]
MTRPALVLLLALVTPAVAGAADGVTVRRCTGSPLTGPAADELRKLAVEFVQSSNFNTATHARILNQSVSATQDQYRRAVAGDCLIVTYDRPVRLRTVGGEVSLVEIVVGLGRADYADGLFTIDESGRVIGHGKYSGSIATELRKAARAAAATR